jgi:hypothetical protein
MGLEQTGKLNPGELAPCLPLVPGAVLTPAQTVEQIIGEDLLHLSFRQIPGEDLGLV